MWLARRASYSICIAFDHYGWDKACFIEVGSTCARRALGLERPVFSLAIMGCSLNSLIWGIHELWIEGDLESDEFDIGMIEVLELTCTALEESIKWIFGVEFEVKLGAITKCGLNASLGLDVVGIVPPNMTYEFTELVAPLWDILFAFSILGGWTIW